MVNGDGTGKGGVAGFVEFVGFIEFIGSVRFLVTES
jgi:hypothetical protein